MSLRGGRFHAPMQSSTTYTVGTNPLQYLYAAFELPAADSVADDTVERTGLDAIDKE